MARFDTVLSFNSHDPDAVADQPTNDHDAAACDTTGSDDDEAEFEFAFAPPLTTTAGREDDRAFAPADDLFAHGRILPAYPVFHRRADDGLTTATTPQASSPDSYCAWTPRSAPGSPAREREFPKSASTGEARRFWRLRDLVGGRSHSDGKEKFVFLQHTSTSSEPAERGKQQQQQHAKKHSAPPQQKQGKKKATEMDMATAHKLFYGKQGALPGAERKQQSYLPYRTGIVGFFTAAHALGRSHHPY